MPKPGLFAMLLVLLALHCVIAPFLSAEETAQTGKLQCDYGRLSKEEKLVAASSANSLGCVQQLLAEGTRVNAVTELYNKLPRLQTNALIGATTFGHFQVVKVLLENGAKVGIRDRRGDTALLVASSNGDVQVAALLLENGAGVYETDNLGQTALTRAIVGGHEDVVELLLAKGAPVNSVTHDGDTALCLAARGGHKLIVDLLKAKGAGGSSVEDCQLMGACRSGDVDTVTRLVQEGANVNSCNGKGWTCLMYASQAGHFEIVKTLVDKGAEVNRVGLVMARTAWQPYPMSPSITGHTFEATCWTALGLASVRGLSHIAELLESHGASENVLQDWPSCQEINPVGYFLNSSGPPFRSAVGHPPR